MKAEIRTETKYYIKCPWCDDDKSFSIGHLIDEPGRTFGNWHCDTCGYAIKGKILENREVEIETVERCKDKTWVLLEFPPDEQSIFLITEGMRFDDFEKDHNEYFYNEHTCPVNYFRSAKVVMIGDDSDPHGLFQYRGYILQDDNPELDQLTWVNDIMKNFE